MDIYGKNYNSMQTFFYRISAILEEQAMLEAVKLERIENNLIKRGCSSEIIKAVQHERELLNDYNIILNPDHVWRYAFINSAPIVDLDITWTY